MKCKELKRYFKRKRIKDCEIANLLHISKGAYSLKINGLRSFSLEDVKIIKDHFKMADSEIVYFFVD